MIFEGGGLEEGACWGMGNFEWECLMTLFCLVCLCKAMLSQIKFEDTRELM